MKQYPVHCVKENEWTPQMAWTRSQENPAPRWKQNPEPMWGTEKNFVSSPGIDPQFLSYPDSGSTVQTTRI
jgi:hypothetical protein